MVSGLSCSACGVLAPSQRSNLHALNCKVDSTTDPQEVPIINSGGSGEWVLCVAHVPPPGQRLWIAG